MAIRALGPGSASSASGGGATTTSWVKMKAIFSAIRLRTAGSPSSSPRASPSR